MAATEKVTTKVTEQAEKKVQKMEAAIAGNIDDVQRWTVGSWFIVCTKCDQRSKEFPTEQEAVTEWNRRSIP